MTAAVLAAFLTVVQPPAETPPAPPGPEVERPADPEAVPGRDAQALNLADLGPYRAALEGPRAGPAVDVTFRELWDDPGSYQGKWVRVEGRVLRRFRQGAFGTFPPLVEAWAVAPSGDPFCLVFPDPNPGAPPGSHAEDAAPGALVRFEGVFLRQIRYQGGDAPRLAPLVVGDAAPTVRSPAPRPVRLEDARGLSAEARSWWALGLVVAGMTALALARRHLRRPYRPSKRRRDELDPPPEFVEPESPGLE